MSKERFEERFTAQKIRRDHSPYCEAKGPIVKEGFVAARVKDFQKLGEYPDEKRSHSPMIPCPTPSYTHQTPPQNLFEGGTTARNLGKRGHIIQPQTSSEQTNTTTSLRKRDSLPLRTPEYSTAAPQKTTPPVDNSKILFSPQAIPPSLAKPFCGELGQACNSRLEGDGPPNLQNITKSQRSIAEKLGSLVDRGWDKRKELGNAFDNHDISNDHEALVYGRDVGVIRPTLSSGDNLGGLSRFQDKAQNTEVCREPLVICKGRRRARTTDHPKHLPSCQDNRIQRRTTSLGRMIDRHLSDWQKLEIVKTPTLNSARPADQASTAASILSSPIDPERPVSAQSSVATQPSKRSSFRSLSWFGKIPRYRLALKDKTSGLEQVPREDDNPDSNASQIQVVEAKRADQSLAKQIQNSESCAYGPEMPESHAEYYTPSSKSYQDLQYAESEGANSHKCSASAAAERTGSMDTEKEISTGKESRSISAREAKEVSRMASPAMSDEGTMTAKKFKRISSRFFSKTSNKPQSMGPENQADSQDQYPSLSEVPQESPPEAVHMETIGRGKGIRRVQVIISLDGADDLLVEARLLKRQGKT